LLAFACCCSTHSRCRPILDHQDARVAHRDFGASRSIFAKSSAGRQHIDTYWLTQLGITLVASLSVGSPSLPSDPHRIRCRGRRGWFAGDRSSLSLRWRLPRSRSCTSSSVSSRPVAGDPRSEPIAMAVAIPLQLLAGHILPGALVLIRPRRAAEIG